MHSTTAADFSRFVESLHKSQPILGSPKAYDEHFSSTTSDTEMEVETPSSKFRRVGYKDELDFSFVPLLPSTSPLTSDRLSMSTDSQSNPVKADEMPRQDLTTRLSSDIWSYEKTMKASAFGLSTAPEVPPSAAEFADTEMPRYLAESQPVRVRQFPDVSSVSSQEDQLAPELSLIQVPYEETKEPSQRDRPTLKRTYQESETLNSLVTSVNIAGESADLSKHVRFNFSDESFASLFGTVTDPITGEQRTEQQIFPKSHWPVVPCKSSFSDHLLTSNSRYEVHIISITPKSTFNLAPWPGEILGTVLASAVDSVELSINGQDNIISLHDSFKLPSFAQARIMNKSPRLKVKVQLVALRD
jgi:hypothetical protein